MFKYSFLVAQAGIYFQAIKKGDATLPKDWRLSKVRT